MPDGPFLVSQSLNLSISRCFSLNFVINITLSLKQYGVLYKLSVVDCAIASYTIKFGIILSAGDSSNITVILIQYIYHFLLILLIAIMI